MSQKQILSPVERYSEIVFGLIMVLTFTRALNVYNAGQSDIREMLLGALGCCLAWGLIDAIFYLINCFVERNRKHSLLLELQNSKDSISSTHIVSRALPSEFTEVLDANDYKQLADRLRKLPLRKSRSHFNLKDFSGALSVFFLVFLSTLPVVLPFILFENMNLALKVSNAIAMLLLFIAGNMLGKYAGVSRFYMGLGTVAIAALLVSIAILLGG